MGCCLCLRHRRPEKKQSNSLPPFANAQKTLRCERIEVMNIIQSETVLGRGLTSRMKDMRAGDKFAVIVA